VIKYIEYKMCVEKIFSHRKYNSWKALLGSEMADHELAVDRTGSAVP